VANAYQEFRARAFHPDLGNEAIEGTVLFTSRSLTFRGGETVIEIPLHRLAAEFDQGEEGRIILRHADDTRWTIIIADTALLDLRSVPQIAELAEQAESRLARRELSRRTKIVLIFFASCGLALWLGMLLVGAMVRSIVAKVPPEVEQEVGKDLLDELKDTFEFVDDTNEVARVAAAAEPLLRALPRGQPWQFYIVEEDMPNAFAIPSGHILVTRGLLRLAERPEEVLGVVAHELAHVMHKHSFRQQIASAGPFLVFQVFLRGQGGALALMTGGSALLVHQSFSQEYEKEADDVGWKYLVAANIDPRGMIDMFRKLKALEATEKHVRLLPKAFESHPDLDKRIARLETKWKRMPRKSGFLDLSSESQPEK
jgi:Zn-dependent protease with chaperone function